MDTKFGTNVANRMLNVTECCKIPWLQLLPILSYSGKTNWEDKIPPPPPRLGLRRFTKPFILEGLSIVIEFNYFCINNYFYHQIKGTAKETIFVVVGSNLTVAYFEETTFAILPQIYPKDFVDFFIRNYF